MLLVFGSVHTSKATCYLPRKEHQKEGNELLGHFGLQELGLAA